MRTPRAVSVLVLVLALTACSPPSRGEPVSSGTAPPVSWVRAAVYSPGSAEVMHLADPALPPTTTTTTAPPATTTSTAPPAVPEPVEAHQAPAPPPPSTTAPHSDGIHPAIAAHFGTGQLGLEAQRVAECESQLNPSAVSATNDHGLFQINRPTWDKPDAWDGWQQTTGTPWSMVYDADTNARFARALYDRSGWSPWTCQP
jgi:hypothetical protein